jgi:hypothetical protein
MSMAKAMKAAAKCQMPGLQVESTSTPDRMLGRAAATFPVPKRGGGSSIVA